MFPFFSAIPEGAAGFTFSQPGNSLSRDYFFAAFFFRAEEAAFFFVVDLEALWALLVFFAVVVDLEAVVDFAEEVAFELVFFFVAVFPPQFLVVFFFVATVRSSFLSVLYLLFCLPTPQFRDGVQWFYGVH